MLNGMKSGYPAVKLDMYIAGCPPHPEALLDGILRLFEKVESQKYEDRGIQQR